MEDVEKRLIAAEKERRMVEKGLFVPDLVLNYDTIKVGEATNQILIEAQQKMLRKRA